jgi:hypothetical protein
MLFAQSNAKKMEDVGVREGKREMRKKEEKKRKEDGKKEKNRIPLGAVR